MRVLVVNAGSSSLKLRVLGDDDEVVAATDVGPDDQDTIRELADEHRVDAVGHRVVHGGDRFRTPTVLDDEVIAALRDLIPLAPLHQPPALAGIEAIGAVLPGTPSVACFDTAFHATIPGEAATYPIPRAWRERFGLRRFGFHGLSHSYASRRAVELAGGRRVVTCHLGAGSSLAAVVDGRCVDTTMGFTPNEGVPMATRSGSVDVGMLTWLLDAGLDQAELADGLQFRSGLAGLAGTADMAEVVRRGAEGDADAVLALGVWTHRVAQAVAAMAASAGGVDVLAFTGGIGERAPSLRQQLGERLRWLGVDVDPLTNETASGDADLSAPGATVRAVLVEAREDLEIAAGVRAAL